MNVYLITLRGCGDTEWKIVRQDGWDFLHGNGPLTQALLDDAAVNWTDEYDLEPVLEVLNEPDTREDDLALHLPAAVIGGSIANFFDAFTLMEFIKNNTLNIVEEYHGQLY